MVYSNDDPRLILTYFTARSNLVSYAFVWGKTVKKSFNGRNVQQMTRVTKVLCLYKQSDPKRLTAPASGLYTCIKIWKSMYKIRRQRYFFWNLQQMGKVTRLYCWHQVFCLQRIICPCPEAIYMWKNIKNVYKIRIQRDSFERDSFETCNKWSKW